MKNLRPPLTVAALGIVFGDIGTSPLYAFREAAKAAGTGAEPGLILGVLSLVFWAITLSISLKYIGLILRRDNDGEGGILALAPLLDLQRSERFGPLLLIALLGAAMLFGDAVITPAISVLSAVEGLHYALPALGPLVVPLAVAILAVLFLAQRAGTARIGLFFGPIMLLWFASLGVLGLIAVLGNPAVLQALDPRHGVALLARDPLSAAPVLSAVFLAITGGEALYADLGHFGRKAITRAWFCIALPGLLLNYFGQGALVLGAPESLRNPFYLLAPDMLRLPLVLLATAATVIASQAVITGIFSLTRQAMETGFLPFLQIQHTTEEQESHVYIAPMNALLGLSAIVLAIGFGSSDALADAYGLAVAMAMITTTVLFVAATIRLGRWPVPLAIAVGAGLLALDLIFFVPSLGKIPTGGWLPLLFACGVLAVMVAWRKGSDRVRATTRKESMALTAMAKDFVKVAATSQSTAIFLSRQSDLAPLPLARLHSLLGTVFARTIILSVQVEGRPRVPHDQRVTLHAINEVFLQVTLRVGYMQQVNVPAMLGPCLHERGIEPDDVIYVIGHERLLPPKKIRRIDHLWLLLFAFLSRNAERIADRFDLPARRTLEVGYPISSKG